MNSLHRLTFDAPNLAVELLTLTDTELDALPYGVVEMNHDCKVLRYNQAESRASGLPQERVVGRHFFREVAPCSDNRHVSQRYGQAPLDETIAYTFSLQMKPVPVTLRMLKPAGGDRMYLLVMWS